MKEFAGKKNVDGNNENRQFTAVRQQGLVPGLLETVALLGLDRTRSDRGKNSAQVSCLWNTRLVNIEILLVNVEISMELTYASLHHRQYMTSYYSLEHYTIRVELCCHLPHSAVS